MPLRVPDLRLDSLGNLHLARRLGGRRLRGLFQRAQSFSARGARLSPLPCPISSSLFGVFEMSSSSRLSFKIRDTPYIRATTHCPKPPYTVTSEVRAAGEWLRDNPRSRIAPGHDRRHHHHCRSADRRLLLFLDALR